MRGLRRYRSKALPSRLVRCCPERYEHGPRPAKLCQRFMQRRTADSLESHRIELFASVNTTIGRQRFQERHVALLLHGSRTFSRVKPCLIACWLGFQLASPNSAKSPAYFTNSRTAA
jgi:hypothetical protein